MAGKQRSPAERWAADKDSSACQDPGELTGGKLEPALLLQKVDYVDSNPLLNINDNQTKKAVLLSTPSFTSI